MRDKKPGRGGSRPGNPNGRRGGARPGAGPTPDLAAHVQRVRTLLQQHQHKLDAADLEALRDQLGAALAEVARLQAPDDAWQGDVL